jgi:hypothetical protein
MRATVRVAVSGAVDTWEAVHLQVMPNEALPVRDSDE